MTFVVTTARALRASALAVAFATAAPLVATAAAQRPDTTQHTPDSARVRQLERVLISAVRAQGLAPVSQKTITKEEIDRRYFGQDVPLVLQGATPSLTSYAETGNYWGYSYMRLRGIDQSRINLTIDGIPLNDPEDQVLYFADFPDLANSLQSVQVQRGVGTSSNGTAAYAGSINMETISPATTPRGGEVQLEGGSFGSKRASVEYASGLLPHHLAIYGRLSALGTDGYRYHSGVQGRSGFVSAGYFGDRDIVKFTATDGGMRDTMAYYAVPVSQLDTNRRLNPLEPPQRDDFAERIAALSYTRLLGPSSSIATTAYRIGAKGDYDVLVDSMWIFHLDFAWYGLTSAWSYRHDDLQLDLGVNGNTYARDHYAFARPDVQNPLYFNTGHKQDASGFAKTAYTIGRATLFGDLQARHADFRYSPDANAGIAERSIGWTFVNPKAGVTYQLTAPLAVYASYGRNTREPGRSDMFAGFDNLDTSNVDFVGSLSRVKPETVHDIEAGVTLHHRDVDLQANLYSMNFQNEIAPIGALSYIGTPLRKNVPSSYRRGIEADVTYRGIPRLLLGANATASVNRIREYTDASGDTIATYRDVEPLLTPRLLTAQHARFAATRNVDLEIESRYQSRAFLQNTSDARYVLPAYWNVDAAATLHVRNYALVVRGNNLTDNGKYGSGYAYGGEPNYYVLPPRNLFVTLRAEF